MLFSKINQFKFVAFSTHMQDLQEVTQETHYENFRAEKLANGGGSSKPRSGLVFLILILNLN